MRVLGLYVYIFTTNVEEIFLKDVSVQVVCLGFKVWDLGFKIYWAWGVGLPILAKFRVRVWSAACGLVGLDMGFREHFQASRRFWIGILCSGLYPEQRDCTE